MKEINSHTIDAVPFFIKNAIKRTADKNNKFSGTKYKKLDQRVHEWFDTNDWITPKAFFYLLKNGFNELPYCEYCNEVQLTPKQYELQYKKDHYFCCAEHASKSEIIREKINKTWEQNGGAPFKRKDVIDKRRETWKEKYGGNNPISDPAVLEKYRKTSMERYGVDNPSKSPEIQNKVKSTLMEHYGVDSPIKCAELNEKRKQTYKENWGTDHPCKTEEVRNRQKKTWMEHYGIDHMSLVPEVRSKIKEKRRTFLWPSRLEIAKKKNLEILSTEEDYLGGKEFHYRCLTCGNKFTDSHGPSETRCYTCYPKHSFVSNKEREVADWIRSFYSGTIDTSNKSIISPYELDIYIPEKKVAIEFDGIYWHSELFKEKNYHQRKTILCSTQGIRLIHVPELIWDNPAKNYIIKSIIRNALGMTEHRLYARNCTVAEIDSRQYTLFLNSNHIQGAITSKYRYGLFWNNQLVAVMGYGASRFKKGEQELHRYCSLVDYNVIGGFQKLLKHSGFNGSTYVDLNFFDGNGYKKAGFDFVSYTEPNYIWFNLATGIFFSRYQAQKHKLPSILDNFDPNLSEHDNMTMNGYVKIYDAGNMKLSYTKNK